MNTLSRTRAIMVVAAIITPPDLLSLVLVTIPLYLLYEVSIKVTKVIERKDAAK